MPQFLIALLVMAVASLVSAQTFTTLHSFTAPSASSPYANSDGAGPQASLTLGNDGNFYGTASGGGGYGYGTVFKVTTNGTLTTLASFNGTSGGLSPIASLTLGTDGNFYSTTLGGGSYGYGTVFQVTTNGTLTMLASFNGTNGAFPGTALTLIGYNGAYQDFYGMTSDGIFQFTTSGVGSGTLGLLVSGIGQGALTRGKDGNLYGMAGGTIFTFNGTLTTLASGNYSIAALTWGSDGNLYGTAEVDSSGDGNGSVFQVTTNGTLTTLASFNGSNGAYPRAALIFGTDGNLYGTTFKGGVTNSTYTDGMGTIFQVTTNGALTTVVSFNSTNGAKPSAALTLGNDGNFYGTTVAGGSSGNGTVFRLSLPPVITVQPQNQTNYAGATVTFLVSATSLNPMVYQWQKNGTNLLNGGNLSGATSNTMTIAGASDADAGVYSVVVSNALSGVTSSNAVLTVDDSLFIASQPQSQAVAVGSNVVFNATVYGATPFVYQWYFNGRPLGSPAAGATVLSYTLTNVETNQAGNYSVQVVNDYGSLTSSNATLTVVVLPPVITTQPTNRTNNAGTTATFAVVVSSVAPTSYQWQKNSTNLINGGKISGATGSTLTIASVSDSDAAIYSVIITNLAGITASSNAALTVIDPPSITTQPLSQQIMLGGNASFNVSVSGTAPLNYQWRFNGANILNATNAAYSIHAVGATNTGNFSVVVTNLAGKVTSSNALLTVIVPPTLALEFWAGYPLLGLNGMLNSNFVVQYSTNLAETNWIILLSLTNLPSSPYLFLDSSGVGQQARFYRALMQ